MSTIPWLKRFMAPFSRQVFKSIKFLIATIFVLLLVSACQNPITVANKYAQEAELNAQKAETVEDWRATDELWRQAFITLKDESSNEEVLDLQNRSTQGRLDALLEIGLLLEVNPPCGSKVSQSGREEPNYWGEIGYVTVSPWTDLKLHQKVKESIKNGSFDQKDWGISTARLTPSNPKQTVPLGTRVQIIRTSLEHYGWGTYKGDLLVRDIKNKEEFWLKTLNFSLTDPQKCLVAEDR